MNDEFNENIIDEESEKEIEVENKPYVYTVIPEEPVKKERKTNNTGLICAFLALTVLFSGLSSFVAVKVAMSKQNNDNKIVIYQNNSTPVNSISGITDISDLVSSIENTVVEVYTEMTAYSLFYGNYITEGAGSGVIFTEDGYIITNNHVIDNATNITVKLHNGKELPAKLIATDSKSDLAVIKVEEKGLQPVVFGDSENLKVGQSCIAIGNPLGTLGGTVTTGILSALSREITIDSQEMTLLQTNTAINPGNSGGGLFDINGNLIGIVNAKSSGEDIEGIGFAIPVNEVKTVVTQLLQYGYVIGRPQLGIKCTSIESMQAAFKYGLSSYGVYVNEVLSENMKKAGLQEGDLIVAIDEYQITGYNSLKAALNHYIAGQDAVLTVYRGREIIEIKIVLEQKTKVQE